MQICACMRHGNRQSWAHMVSSANSSRDSCPTSRAIATCRRSCIRHCLGTDANGSYSFKADCNAAAEATRVQTRMSPKPFPHAEDFLDICAHCAIYRLGTHTGGSYRVETHRNATAGAMGAYLNRQDAQTLVHTRLVLVRAGTRLYIARFPAGQYHLYYLVPD